MKIVPINTAEAVFEPFWDPELRETDQWNIQPKESTGTSVDKNWWCSLNFEWQNSEDGDEVLTMSRDYGEGLDVSSYDHLLLSAMVPNGCSIRIEAGTECGVRTMTSTPFEQEKRELRMPLSGSKRIQSLCITVIATKSSTGMGWFNWVGLQNSSKLDGYLAMFRCYTPEWEGSLYPVNLPLTFTPKYGIFISSEQLEKMRALYQQAKANGGASPFAPDTSYEKYFTPEACINDFVNFWDDTRYCRERDSRNYLIRNGVRAALYGILEQDAESLRLAARYAMSILSCNHWDDGFICDFPVGSWEHRCFVQSLCMYDLVFIYDLASEFFTQSAKSRLFRRLAEEGLASINYISWRHEYIFHNNQMIWFSHGRMAAYALLSKEMPRVARYMEIAYRDVVENIQNTVLPDGGYVEGPTYFTCVGQNGGQALYLYANAVGKKIEEVVPDNLRASSNFADALLSTDRDQDMIPICDARPIMPHSHLAFMAYLLKDSKWVEIFQKAIGRSGGLSDDYFGLIVQSLGLEPKAETRPFVIMPEMNLASSHRCLDGKDVKLLVLGNRSGAGHTHEDKGSFVLEYAGQTFAMDPGTCDYSSPYSMMYKYCQRHNVLVPAGSWERPAAENPSMETIAVEGTGDNDSLHVSLNAGKAYLRYYEQWNRKIDSDTPREFVITDTYSLKEGCGCDHVEFLWNTMLPVERQGDCVVITGENATVRIHIPENTTCELRVLEMFQNQHQNQVAFLCKQDAGQIVTRVELL